MRDAGLLAGLVIAGATAVSVSALTPGPEPILVTAGAGLLGAGIVGQAVETFDAVVARRRISSPLGSDREEGLSKTDRLVVTLGAAAVFVRVALVHLVADPWQAMGAALTVFTVVTMGVAVGYETADGLADGLRHGLLACGLGGALCVYLAAYDARAVASKEAFDAVVAGSGLVLPVAFGLFGGLSGVVGVWLADHLARIDPLA